MVCEKTCFRDLNIYTKWLIDVIESNLFIVNIVTQRHIHLSNVQHRK